MHTATLKRNVFRLCLTGHLLGVSVIIGMRFCALVIENQTGHEGLQALASGRDLTGVLAARLALPGLLVVIGTGVGMTLVRYGARPPLWVWIKVALTAVALVIATPRVAPALAAARKWAHWSADHNHLAPQFQDSASQAAFYGAIVFGLFLLNVPVAVWKPLAAVRFPGHAGPRA